MATTWQTVRVFISSTFRDMHAERDHLVKVVFPRLRQWCEQRRLHLVDIDLRWGVTKEDADDGKAIEICLRQIDGSRPFFLCSRAPRSAKVSRPRRNRRRKVSQTRRRTHRRETYGRRQVRGRETPRTALWCGVERLAHSAHSDTALKCLPTHYGLADEADVNSS